MDSCSISPWVDTIGTGKILIVGDYPDPESLAHNMPFSDKRGEVLVDELQRVGIPISRCALTYICPHEPTKGCSSHLEDVILEMKNRDGVLLIGTGCAAEFRLGKISELVGLTVNSPLFPSSAKFVMITTQPPHSDFLGEFRLSIEKFAKKLKEVRQ